ncbi:hypothetical protein I316_07893 [Kwoniella heveanensis BCC8398]|uniref:Uncharacterized protein n=1 Tax=Kwoniella heveanensis BCC8398 TaxID=1296120 RepID=A0A1B9GHL3_9TREE|nr:hypothetical protein I316_07893 [Kwoniella heveanensis BCC8398]
MGLGVALVILGGGGVLRGKGVEGRVIPRAAVGSQGSPLLLGPNGGETTSKSNGNPKPANSDASASDDSNNDDDNSGDESDASASNSTSTIASSGSITSRSSTVTASTTTSASASVTTSSLSSTMTVTWSQTSSPTTSTSKADRDVLDSGPPRQPSSVRYLVPVFLLILIGIAGFAFQKYRKRRRLSRRRSSAGKEFEKAMKKGQDPFGDDGGWERVREEHDQEKEGHDEDDPWYAGDMEDAPQLKWEEGLKNSGTTRYTFGDDGRGGGFEGSGGLVSAGAKGWGWKDSWNQFKSARGRLNEQAHLEDEQYPSGNDAKNGGVSGPVEKRTMKLVTSPNPNAGPEYSPTDRSGENGMAYSRVPTDGEEGSGFVEVNIGDHTYQDVPIIRHRPPTESDQTDSGNDSNRGSIRALRDKLASLTFKTPLSPVGGKVGGKQNLERNRSPNKRSSNPRSISSPVDAAVSQMTLAPVSEHRQAVVAVPPSPPAWIRPRAVSPTSMSILSPPMQPHLFFHPTPLPSASEAGMNKGNGPVLGGHMQMIADDDHSVSEYASDYDETPLPSANPSPNPADDIDNSAALSPVKSSVGVELHSKFPRIPSTASGLAGADSFSVISSNKSVPNAGANSAKSIQPTSKLNPANGSDSSKKDITASPALAVALRRSAASKSLSRTTRSSPLSRRESKGKKTSSPLLSTTDMPDSEIARSKSLARTRSKCQTNSGSDGVKQKTKMKTRTQRKEERARDKVEDILKASWSDRALASPPLLNGGLNAITSSEGTATGEDVLQQKGGGRMTMVPGLMSPGLEETGGIEQRLALLKNVVI